MIGVGAYVQLTVDLVMPESRLHKWSVSVFTTRHDGRYGKPNCKSVDQNRAFVRRGGLLEGRRLSPRSIRKLCLV